MKVLADQHDQLMGMLRALDKLGEVGTRVVNGTKDNLLEDLRNIRPALHEISRPPLPTALSLLISFPFPIESNNIVYGDYANTKIAFEINLDNLFRNAQGRRPVAATRAGAPQAAGLRRRLPPACLQASPGPARRLRAACRSRRARTSRSASSQRGPGRQRRRRRGGGGLGGGGLGGLLGRSTTTQDSGMATSMSELLGGPA